jgi:hypothetical protein
MVKFQETTSSAVEGFANYRGLFGYFNIGSADTDQLVMSRRFIEILSGGSGVPVRSKRWDNRFWVQRYIVATNENGCLDALS